MEHKNKPINHMKPVCDNLEKLLNRISAYVFESSKDNMARKVSPKKWSKKEILGHLVDSGINNLQRFTEIQFKEKPYQIRSYNQDELVKANNYHNSKTEDILTFLIAINKRIIDIVSSLTSETLTYEIITCDSDKLDLKYLIEDYVKHFEHHTNQITE